MRRRLVAGALVTAGLLLTACSVDPSSSTVAPVSSPMLGPSATVPASATTATATTATATTTTTTTATTASSVACRPVEVVVLGNSTDYWPNYVVGVDAPTDDAWPALLDGHLSEMVPDVAVDVINASVLGAGFDQGLYGVTSMQQRLAELAEADAIVLKILVLAPSLVDLQLRSLDVDASFAAFETLLGVAVGSFDDTIVLPMNPVATGFDPAVAAAISGFNARLDEAALLAPESSRSPLLSDDGVTGWPEYYDDFDDGRLDTPGPDPDFLHPDRDGHEVIAKAVARWLVSVLDARCV